MVIFFSFTGFSFIIFLSEHPHFPFLLRFSSLAVLPSCLNVFRNMLTQPRETRIETRSLFMSFYEKDIKEADDSLKIANCFI